MNVNQLNTRQKLDLLKSKLKAFRVAKNDLTNFLDQLFDIQYDWSRTSVVDIAEDKLDDLYCQWGKEMHDEISKKEDET